MSGPAPVTQAVTWDVELEDAVVQALGVYLRSPGSGLGAQGPPTYQPAIGVAAEWPEADDPLVMPHVTVLRAGEPEIEDLSPIVVGSPVFVEGNVYTYTWLLGYGTLPLQVDVWARSKPQRGDTLSRLRKALTMGADVTLAAYIAAQAALTPPNLLPPHDPVTNEILLELGAPYAGTIASYYFEKARLHEATNTALRDLSSSSGEAEWRATFNGSATYSITRTSNSPALQSIALSAQVAGRGDPGPLSSATASPGGPFVTTITPTTVKQTR